MNDGRSSCKGDAADHPALVEIGLRHGGSVATHFESVAGRVSRQRSVGPKAGKQPGQALAEPIPKCRPAILKHGWHSRITCRTQDSVEESIYICGPVDFIVIGRDIGEQTKTTWYGTNHRDAIAQSERDSKRSAAGGEVAREQRAIEHWLDAANARNRLADRATPRAAREGAVCQYASDDAVGRFYAARRIRRAWRA